MRMTEATMQALDGLRDLSTLKWYVIPLLGIVAYIYTREAKEARKTGDWNAILCGLTVFGMVLFNETWNGWVMVLTERSALWTAPGETALRTMIGGNIEIWFMFTLLGLVFYHSLSDGRDKRILGLNEKWFWAIGYSAFCVFVECLLNLGGHLVWEYPFWRLSMKGLGLIFLIGYFHFFCAAILVLHMKSLRSRLITVGVIYSIPAAMNVLGLGLMGWVY
jgi:hypothetical protein